MIMGFGFRPKVGFRFVVGNSDSLLEYLQLKGSSLEQRLHPQDGEVEWMLVSDNKPVLSHACCETGGMSLGLLVMLFLLRVAEW